MGQCGVPEAQAGLAPGNAVEARAVAYQENFHGTVNALLPEIDEATHVTHVSGANPRQRPTRHVRHGHDCPAAAEQLLLIPTKRSSDGKARGRHRRDGDSRFLRSMWARCRSGRTNRDPKGLVAGQQVAFPASSSWTEEPESDRDADGEDLHRQTTAAAAKPITAAAVEHKRRDDHAVTRPDRVAAMDR